MTQNENHSSFIDVGDRLREMRQERNLSMRALARLSGLSTNALSMIERGLTSPSVSTLHKLSTAMEIPITAFFRYQKDRQNVVYLKASSRSKQQFDQGEWEVLGGDMFDGRVEPFLMTVNPGSSSRDFGITHSGHEFVICLSGTLTYVIEGQQYVLEPLDVLLFDAHLRHSWQNANEEPAVAICIVSGFSKQERPGEHHKVSMQQTTKMSLEN